jgi:mRNA-degrading endonuclease RelE of RelBE toxin-antitoxin system
MGKRPREGDSLIAKHVKNMSKSLPDDVHRLGDPWVFTDFWRRLGISFEGVRVIGSRRSGSTIASLLCPQRNSAGPLGTEEQAPGPRGAKPCPIASCVPPEARDNLRALTARQRSLVVGTIDDQLADEPTVETRNRKQMWPHSLAPWELRIGDLRVYYNVEALEAAVVVVDIGVKRRERVYVGGKVIDL